MSDPIILDFDDESMDNNSNASSMLLAENSGMDLKVSACLFNFVCFLIEDLEAVLSSSASSFARRASLSNFANLSDSFLAAACSAFDRSFAPFCHFCWICCSLTFWDFASFSAWTAAFFSFAATALLFSLGPFNF